MHHTIVERQTNHKENVSIIIQTFKQHLLTTQAEKNHIVLIACKLNNNPNQQRNTGSRNDCPVNFQCVSGMHRRGWAGSSLSWAELAKAKLHWFECLLVHSPGKRATVWLSFGTESASLQLSSLFNLSASRKLFPELTALWAVVCEKKTKRTEVE